MICIFFHNISGVPGKTAVYDYIQNKPLRNRLKHLKSEICRLRRKGRTFKQQLANSEKIANDTSFQYVMKQTSSAVCSHAASNKKKAKGRRFSIEEKVLCLSLYKKVQSAIDALANFLHCHRLRQ